MENLWLAIVLYTVGLALILTLRPRLMFNENGTWKEFGYQRTDSSRHTIFPFWLFAVAWAFLSYAIAASIGFAWMPLLASGSMAAASNNVRFNLPEEMEQVDSEDEEEDGMNVHEDLDDVFGTPVSEGNAGAKPKTKANANANANKKKLRSGYYVIDPASKENGLRTYVYYGKEKPTN